MAAFSFNGVSVTKETSDNEHITDYTVRSPGLAPVRVSVDWSKFPPSLRTTDVLDHVIDRALRSSKQARLWRKVYCGTA